MKGKSNMIDRIGWAVFATSLFAMLALIVWEFLI
jgi:hypothetical protein